jgi:hypothetical protein
MRVPVLVKPSIRREVLESEVGSQVRCAATPGEGLSFHWQAESWGSYEKGRVPRISEQS